MVFPVVRFFVYGSLKRGFDNHERYCRGLRSRELVETAGRLRLLVTGYPVLVLAPSRILAHGSSDPFADLETQQRIAEQTPTSPSADCPSALGRGRVHGELLTFADPADRLRAIDSLEEFRPGRKTDYERVLVRVDSRLSQGEVLAWTYVAGRLAAGRRLIPTGRWAGR